MSKTINGNGLSYLARDHRRIQDMLSNYKSLSRQQVSSLQQQQHHTPNVLESKKHIADCVVKELSVHAAIEEMHLYPILRKKIVPSSEGNMLADRSIQEHQDVKCLLPLLLFLLPLLLLLLLQITFKNKKISWTESTSSLRTTRSSTPRWKT